MINGKITVENSVNSIRRGSEFVIDNNTYVSLFDLTLDRINENATYGYTIYEITKVPELNKTWSTNEYALTSTGITFSRGTDPLNDGIYVKMLYNSTEDDFASCLCEMSIVGTDKLYSMTNTATASTGGMFECTVPYVDFPIDLVECSFRIYNSDGNISQYVTNVVFSKNLEEYMMSNMVVGDTTSTIFDVPLIDKTYYASIDQADFEMNIMQKSIEAFEFKKYVMLTDFLNMKYSTTTGKLTNMKFNSTTLPDIKAMNLTAVPTDAEHADSFIVSGFEGGAWSNQRDNIATYHIVNEDRYWTFISPAVDDLAYVESLDTKLIFTEFGWKAPVYDIPLKLSIEVHQEDNYIGVDGQLEREVKTALCNYFNDKFGANKDLYRSKLIDVIHNVDGVRYCRILEPYSNIFFDFDISKFSQENLLEYGPQYVFFTEDSIDCKVIIGR